MNEEDVLHQVECGRFFLPDINPNRIHPNTYQTSLRKLKVLTFLKVFNITLGHQCVSSNNFTTATSKLLVPALQ